MYLAILKSFALILSYLPESFVRLLGSFASFCYVVFPNKARTRALQNIQLIYGLSMHAEFARLFLRQNLEAQVYIFFDTLRYILRKKRMQIQNEDLLARIFKDELNPELCPAFFVTAHLGSWELAGCLLARYSQAEVYVLAKPGKNKVYEHFLNWIRELSSLKVLWTDRPSLGRQMASAIKSGSILGFVMDQKPEKRQGILVDFLGQKTPFVSGPGGLSIKYGVPVYSIFVLREGPQHYRLISELIYDPKSAENPLSPEDLTQACAEKISSAIRLYPEQWTWNYKRWKINSR